jgi:surfeit locus 1 family protein
MQRMETALQLELFPQVLYLSADNDQGFEDRQWSPVSMPPKKHRAYAFQWFALALTTMIAWLAISIKRTSKT